MSDAKSVDIGLEELRSLRALSRAVDDLLEEGLKNRDNLTQTFKRVFPRLMKLTGATAIAVSTQNEDLANQTWSEGDFGGVFAGNVLAEHKWGIHKFGASTLICQQLDVL